MTALAAQIARRIHETGPMTIAEYMAECLLDPRFGYYTTRPPFGREGDFTTAPEISQMFGELLGLWLAQSWLDQGAPGRFCLAEIGPGRGTLMADILRATRGVPGFHAAAQVILIEASPRLRALQAERLAPHGIGWADDISALSQPPYADLPLFVLGNEFFDALPIRQFIKDTGGWRERLVGLKDGALHFGLSDSSPSPALDAAFSTDAPGTLVEICPQAGAIMADLARHITARGGAALFVDYGDWGSKGDTFQAVRAHGFTDPLNDPGMADLTAHVDFRALAQAARPLSAHYTTQGAFLAALGIAARAARLAQGMTGAALENHQAAYHRLTDAQEMGSLFKVLALTRPDTPPPPGFA